MAAVYVPIKTSEGYMFGPANIWMELANVVCGHDGSAKEMSGAKTTLLEQVAALEASKIVTTWRLSCSVVSYPGDRPASATV